MPMATEQQFAALSRLNRGTAAKSASSLHSRDTAQVDCKHASAHKGSEIASNVIRDRLDQPIMDLGRRKVALAHPLRLERGSKPARSFSRWSASRSSRCARRPGGAYHETATSGASSVASCSWIHIQYCRGSVPSDDHSHVGNAIRALRPRTSVIIVHELAVAFALFLLRVLLAPGSEPAGVTRLETQCRP